MTGNRMLVVDDLPEIGDYIAEVGEGLGYEVDVARNGKEFRQLYETARPDVIVLDIVMPGEDGIELIKYLAKRGCTSRILVISGYNELYLDQSKALGKMFGLAAVETLKKPIEIADLRQALALEPA